MVFTNVSEHGGLFDNVVKDGLDTSSSVSIASGYVSLDVIEHYAGAFEAIARSGGKVRLLVGMAFYEGLNKSKLDRLNRLSLTLSELSPGSGVYIPYERRFHGKIYSFEKTQYEDEQIYIGSSNFSSTGIKTNMEATAQIIDTDTKTSVKRYLEYLFSEDVSKTIDKLDILVPGSRKYLKKVSVNDLSDLGKFDPSTINTQDLPYFDYDLARVAPFMKSNLNVYFAKGRLNSASGKISPRDWYETAMIAPSSIINNPLYPKGKFDAYTDDGYILPMATRGDNFKNIESQGNLRLLGMWIKNRLQKSGALIPLTPISTDTLEVYGRSSIRFFKINEKAYYVDFSVGNPDVN